MSGLELVLTRSPDDRQRFDLAGYGSVRKHGLLDPTVDLELLDGTVLRTDKFGFFRSVYQALDGSNTVKVTIADPAADPGLVLFLVWVAQRIVATNDGGASVSVG